MLPLQPCGQACTGMDEVVAMQPLRSLKREFPIRSSCCTRTGRPSLRRSSYFSNTDTM